MPQRVGKKNISLQMSLIIYLSIRELQFCGINFTLMKIKPLYVVSRRNSILSQTLTINNANSIHNSNFNANVPTVIIVHGWLSNQHTDINPTIRRGNLSYYRDIMFHIYFLTDLL